jgi:molybdopterin molybdotransferase
MHGHVRGTATAIATGAPLPFGADAVIPIEDVGRHGDHISVIRTVTPGDHIFPPGEDAKKGEVLITAGKRLHAGSLALLASAGINRLQVFRRVRVAIVCTGDELVPVDATPALGEIRNSNGLMLTTLVEECGGEVVQCDVVPDVLTELRSALQKAFENADIVITSGGASSGPRDFVKASLASLETDFLFRSVAMRPGRPMAFGKRHGTTVAVLPGNPAAAFVGFMELVRPALLRLAGLFEARLARVTAQIREGKAKAKLDRCSFLFASIAFDKPNSAPALTLLANQCSSLTRTAAAANSLVVLPSSSNTYGCGDVVQADILPWAV